MHAETSRKLTRSRLSICTICRHLTFRSFVQHGRSNAALASTIAFDCSLTLLAIFTLVLPVIRKMPIVVLPEIKEMLKKVRPRKRADQNHGDRPSTVPWEGQHASPSSAFSSPASPRRSSLPQPRRPPPRPARPRSPCLLAPLPPAQMRPRSYAQKASPCDGWETRSVSASTTMASLCEMQSFCSKEGVLHVRQEV